MEALGGRRGVTVINDAYNASPGLDGGRPEDARADRRPGERTVAVLGEMSELGEFAGEEHDRIGLLAVRLDIHQLSSSGRRPPHAPLRRSTQGSWDGESLYFATPDEAFEYLLAALIDRATPCSSSRRTRPVSGSSAIVWQNSSAA